MFKQDLRNEWFYERTFMTRKLNGLINFGLKVPLLKELFPSQPYATFKGKKVLFIILFVLNIFRTLLAKVLWLFLGFALTQGIGALVLPANQVPVADSLKLGLLGWGFLTIFLARAYKILFFSGFDKEVQQFTQQFQIDRKRYLRGSLLIQTFSNGLAYLPALIGLAFLYRAWWVPFWGIIFYFGCIFFYEALRRAILVYLPRKIRTLINLLCWGGPLAGWGFLGYHFSQSRQTFLFQPVGYLIALAVGILALTFIMKNPRENKFLEQSIESGLRFTEVFQNSNKNQYVASGLNMQKNLVLTETRDFGDLSGSQYLNALLFYRYRHILGKRVRYQTLLLGLIAVVMIAVRIFAGPFDLPDKEISLFFPMLFFFIYAADFGRTIVQMVFVNCDRAMLYYPFYREPKTILRGFNYRFFKSFLYNGSLCGGIFILFFLLSALNNFSFSGVYLATLAFLLLGLNFLFSFHALFVYYLLQPFTGDMEVVNPLYKLVSGATYVVAYLNMQLKFTGVTYALIVAAASLLYVGIGFIVLYKKAPQTFKIK